MMPGGSVRVRAESVAEGRVRRRLGPGQHAAVQSWQEVERRTATVIATTCTGPIWWEIRARLGLTDLSQGDTA